MVMWQCDSQLSSRMLEKVPVLASSFDIVNVVALQRLPAPPSLPGPLQGAARFMAAFVPASVALEVIHTVRKLRPRNRPPASGACLCCTSHLKTGNPVSDGVVARCILPRIVGCLPPNRKS